MSAIGTSRTLMPTLSMSAIGGKADIAQSSPLIGTRGPTGTLGDLIDFPFASPLGFFHRLQRGFLASAISGPMYCSTLCLTSASSGSLRLN